VSNRPFGVEIECYAPNPERDIYGDYCDGVAAAVSLLYGNNFRSWCNLVSSDESLDEGGAEIKSPVLYGQPGFDELKSVVNLLNANEYYVDSDCGLHVHLDAPEFINDPKLIIKTVKSWKKNQNLINNMVADSRIDNGACELWRDVDIEELEEYLSEINPIQYLDGTLRGAINFGSLSYHGTIEIRQHEGTLNYEEIESWIKFCQAFVDSMTGKEVRQISTEELLLKRLKVERNASRFLTTKARLNKQRREARA
jgi:hypothetical protein